MYSSDSAEELQIFSATRWMSFSEGRSRRRPLEGDLRPPPRSFGGRLPPPPRWDPPDPLLPPPLRWRPPLETVVHELPESSELLQGEFEELEDWFEKEAT